jgi:hypothetical protein
MSMSASMKFEGQFAVWAFTIGHGRLLIRRTKSDEHPTRVDILLKDVGWMCIPVNFTDIQIREVPLEEAEGLLAAAGRVRDSDRKLFRLSGLGWQGYVLAAVMTSHEDEGEYDDPSHLME